MPYSEHLYLTLLDVSVSGNNLFFFFNSNQNDLVLPIKVWVLRPTSCG